MKRLNSMELFRRMLASQGIMYNDVEPKLTEMIERRYPGDDIFTSENIGFETCNEIITENGTEIINLKIHDNRDAFEEITDKIGSKRLKKEYFSLKENIETDPEKQHIEHLSKIIGRLYNYSACTLIDLYNDISSFEDSSIEILKKEFPEEKKLGRLKRSVDIMIRSPKGYEARIKNHDKDNREFYIKNLSDEIRGITSEYLTLQCMDFFKEALTEKRKKDIFMEYWNNGFKKSSDMVHSYISETSNSQSKNIFDLYLETSKKFVPRLRNVKGSSTKRLFKQYSKKLKEITDKYI